MNLIELEEGIINLIATQPDMLNNENAKVISGIKNIIDSFKAFEYSVDAYEGQDLIKSTMADENLKLELKFVSYACEVLQENGVNILLYVPKYAGIYNKTLNKYTTNITPISEHTINQNNTSPETDNSKNEQTKNEQIDNNAQTQKSENKSSQGRDYLMELLKK